ncbi:MAG TPA: carboxyltransferase domain-containing protein [Polyangiaceae bacterium]
MRLEPFGDGAWRAELPSDTVVSRARALLDALRAADGVLDVVVSERHVLVVPIEATEDVRAAVDALVERALDGPVAENAGATHVVRVRYDGADLVEVAATMGADAREVARLHAAGRYACVAVGFLPGFAYLRGLDPRLVIPRRASPRTRVPAHAVAVAGPYTGVYPFASPGGWNLLGTAVGFSPFAAASGAAIQLGDHVVFEEVA